MGATFNAFETATGILKEQQKGMVSQLYTEGSSLLKVIKPKTDKVQGSGVVFSAQVENPQGFGSRSSASAAFPKAVPGKYIEIRTGTGRCYLTMEFDRKMLEAAGANKEGKVAFVNHLENEMKGAKTTLNMEISRQLFGSKTGFVFDCGTTTASLTVQLSTTTSNMQYAIEGQHIDLVDKTTGVAIANGLDRVIEEVDVTNFRIKLNSDGGVVTTDSDTRIVREGSYNAEMTGLNQIISATEDIYGVVTANQRRWKAYLSGSNIGALTLKAVEKYAMEAQVRSGTFCDLIISSPSKMQQIANSLRGTSFVWDFGTTPKPPSEQVIGYDRVGLLINGHKVEWISDPHCKENKIIGLRKEYIGIQHLGDPDFIKMNGEILHPNIYGSGGSDMVKAVLAYYPEFICERRNPHFMMEGVNDMSGW